jgi:sugar porter (SP) family MFS transporter
VSSLSAIVGTSQYVNFFGNPSGVVQGAIGSSLAAGSVVGAALAGPASDRWGRRDTIFVSCFFWVFGTIIQASTVSTGMLIAGRILNGVTIGVTSAQVPVYLAEIAKKDIRGALIIFQEFAIEIGVLVMYFIGYGASFISGATTSFRLAWAMQLIPCLVLMAGLPFLPRSPRWLAKVGRLEEAYDILAKVQANGNRDDPVVVAEWQEITLTLNAEREALRGWRKFIKNGMWRRTLAGISVMVWQQLTGANALIYYVVYIFQMAGLTGNINLISAGALYASLIIGTAITYLTVDKVGRRPLLVLGILGMGTCQFVVGGVLGQYGTYLPDGLDGNLNVKVTVTGAASHTVIAFSYIGMLLYGLTLAPVPWVYCAEVWSLETRSVGMSVAVVFNWLCNFALGLFVPPAFSNITWKTFIVFGVLCFAGGIHMFLQFPETGQKTLEEVEELFQKGAKPAWKTRVGQSHLDEKVAEIKEHKQEEAMQVEHIIRKQD